MVEEKRVGLKPAAWFLIIVVVLGLIGLGVYSSRDTLFPQSKTGGDITAGDLAPGEKPEAPDATGITTVQEYKYVPGERLPEGKGTASYAPLKDNTVVMGLNVWAGWAPIFFANGGTDPSAESLFFKKYGLKVAVKIIDSPSASIQAFASGHARQPLKGQPATPRLHTAGEIPSSGISLHLRRVCRIEDGACTSSTGADTERISMTCR